MANIGKWIEERYTIEEHCIKTSWCREPNVPNGNRLAVTADLIRKCVAALAGMHAEKSLDLHDECSRHIQSFIRRYGVFCKVLDHLPDDRSYH